MPFDWISVTTDYGSEDGFVAACEGVMATIAPGARTIHVSHHVPRGDVRRGAAVMAQVLPYLPPAVHVAVVDPGVGTERRGVAVVCPGSVLVGPDNGVLLAPAAALGGVTAAYQLSDPRFWRHPVSNTFHGRDVFAPVAAHVAAGADPADLGPALAPADLVAVAPARVEMAPGMVAAEVIGVDHFGNVQLAATPADLDGAGLGSGDPVLVAAGGDEVVATAGKTFADAGPGGLVVLVDSAGQVAVAVNGGSAADRLGATGGDMVSLRPAPAQP